MNKPNFLIIGVAKSGTTTLYEQLKAHPDVFMPEVKEPNYFAVKDYRLKFKKESVAKGYYESFVYKWEDYLNLFPDNDNKQYKAIGEASPVYLYDENAPSEIKNALPNVKLIAILRNPIERAFSNFAMHHTGLGYETTPDFMEALALEEQRKKEHWWWGFYYKEAGLYTVQLKRYLDLFDKNKILIILYDDLKNDKKNTYLKITNFLDITPIAKENLDKKYKVTEIPKRKFVEQLLHNKILISIGQLIPKTYRSTIKQNIRKFNNFKPVITKEAFVYLSKYYEKEIKELGTLLNRDLSHWLIYNSNK